jgi:hypothetical protein
MSEMILDPPLDSPSDVPVDAPPDLRADLALLGAQLSELQALLARERAAIREEKRESLLRAVAVQSRAVDPADVIAWATREQPDAFAGLVTEQEADVDGARALVEQCRAARPHYFRSSAPGVPSNAGAGVQPPDDEMLNRALNGRRLFSL